MAWDHVRRMQALFAPLASHLHEGGWQPSADVYETKDGGWLIKFDIAGVRPEDIRLSAAGKRLILQGTRRDTVHEQGCRYYRMEISYSRFERTVELPTAINPAKVQSEYRDGMLFVHIDPEAKS